MAAGTLTDIFLFLFSPFFFRRPLALVCESFAVLLIFNVIHSRLRCGMTTFIDYFRVDSVAALGAAGIKMKTKRENIEV